MREIPDNDSPPIACFGEPSWHCAAARAGLRLLISDALWLTIQPVLWELKHAETQLPDVPPNCHENIQRKKQELMTLKFSHQLFV